MKIIHQTHPEDFVKYNTQQIRERFLLEKLVEPNSINCVYTHYDRMIIGAASPLTTGLKLGTYDALKSEHFLDRREMGIINIGATGVITVDGEQFSLDKLDCLYIGKGKKTFSLAAPDQIPFPQNIFSFPVRHTLNIRCNS